MPVFKETDSFYKLLNLFIEELKKEKEISSKLLESKLLVRFIFKEPDGILTVDLTKDKLTHTLGNSQVKADVELTQKADIAHLFWQGRLNIARAIATRQVVARGSVPKALALLPALKPAYQIYCRVSKEQGYQHEDSEDNSAVAAKKRKLSLAQPFDRLKSLFKKNDNKEIILKDLPQIILTDKYDIGEPVCRKRVLPESKELLQKEMLRYMLLIRYFEEHLSKSFVNGIIPTEAIHLSIGQEAAAVGVCFALECSDYMTTTHRGHGHMIAKGADIKGMMAELYGKADGLCKGKGGSMHVTASDVGALGANGIVGASSLIATGSGLKAYVTDAFKNKNESDIRVSVAFMGDGATNQGMFHESLNMASVFNLPVIFVVENNLYGEFTPLKSHVNIDKLSLRAGSYGIPGIQVDGNNVVEVYEAALKAINMARQGQGPALLECLTYRWHGHMEGEALPYRSAEEIEEWKKRCPIKKLKNDMLNENIITEKEINLIEEEAKKDIGEAVVYAENSPEPDEEDLYKDVFSPEPKELYTPGSLVNNYSKTRLVTVAQAIREALQEEMERDNTVFLLGEDVTTGGYFSVTTGLVEQFSKNRVIDTPISEYAIGGGAVGAAMVGLRPVAEILFSDFITCCMDPLVNQAAKMRYMSGGQYSVPLVIRTPGGAGLGMAAQHSQSLESLLIQIPGLIIMAPGNAYDTKGLLKSAIRSNNPVLFFENKLMYTYTGNIPIDEYLVPIGVAEVKREGNHVTVVAVGSMVENALEAAEICIKKGVSVEVIDPRTLIPCDWKTILQSVKKTGALVTVEEGHLNGSFGSEVAAKAVEALPGILRSVLRVAGKNVPIPYNKKLENLAIPSVEDIVNAVILSVKK